MFDKKERKEFWNNQISKSTREVKFRSNEKPMLFVANLKVRFDTKELE